jgi:hypothetical protein
VSAEAVVEAALVARLTDDENVRAVVGEPVRLARAGEGGLAYPFLELGRHEARPADAQDAPASEHLIELAVLSRHDGGAAAREGAAAVRAAVEAGLAPASGRCVLALATGATTAVEAGGVWRSTVRLRVVFEPG